MSATIDEFQQGFTFLRDPRFVSIAVVQGYAIGAGFQLALLVRPAGGRGRRAVLHEGVCAGPGPRPDGNKTAGRGGWLRKGAGDLRDGPDGRSGGSRRHRTGHGRRTSDDLDATVADLVGALTAPLPGAVRETKALLQAASSRTLDDQRRFEREAQIRRFREMARLMAGQG